MSDLWLTPDEVAELTAYKRWGPQCKALAAMGVEFTPNRVGRPLVKRAAYESQAKPRKKAGPNWDAIRRVA